MTKMGWTAEQQKVIDSRNRNLLVSAAAGSGKTAVLVERIIRMVTDPEDPADIDRLLVMTFTNAAAAEMRERIGDALEEKLEEQPGNRNLERQATLIHHAKITTIDSFCLGLLREHFQDLDIDPGFRIGEEGELLLIQTDVMKELLEEYYGRQDEKFLRFVDAYASGKADGGIEDYILQVWKFSQSNPWPGQWIAGCRKEMEEGAGFFLGEKETPLWIRFLIQDVKVQAEELAQQLLEALEISREEDGPQSYIPMLTEEWEAMEELAGLSSYEAIHRFLSDFSFGRLAAARGKQVDPEKKDQAAALRNQAKDTIKKMKGLYVPGTLEEIASDLSACREPILVLLSLAEDFAARYQEAKEEKNLVDFNDLEHFALEILTAGSPDHRPGPVADELSKFYREILVDEYQDSNEVQETLIRCISRERFGEPNVFMVGDVKQSIYKFRLAKPELFLKKYESYGREEGLYQKIELHKNFRSRPEVLSSINDIFYGIMTKKLGNIPYTEEAALYAGADYPAPQRPGETMTELFLLNTGSEMLKAMDEERADYTAKEAEARLIAGKIKELTNPETGVKIWNGKKGQYEPLRRRDIVILLRSLSGWAEEFVSVLGAEGIPAFAESRTGYFTAVEVETVLNMLALVDNPMQDIPLAGVLRSPIGGLEDRDLAIVMAAFKKNPKKGEDSGFYGAVRQFLARADGEEGFESREGFENREEFESREGFENREEFESREGFGNRETFAGREIAEKLRNFWKILEILRKEAEYLPVHRLLYRIFELTGYYDYVSAMPAGKTRQANLNMLVEKASSYEKTSYQSLFDFIRYIDKLKKYNTDFGEAAKLGENDDTVRIMSIHKSKGLEFPVVFLAGGGKHFNRQDSRGKILIDEELGIATDFFDSELKVKAPTLKKNVISRRMNLESMGEELRVLYVAMTRAKEKLIITAADNYLENRLEKWSRGAGGEIPFTSLAAANSYLDWLLMASEGAKNTMKIQKVPIEGLLAAEIKSQTGKLELSMALEAIREEKSTEAPFAELMEKPYAYEADVTLHAKMSVSELKEQGQFVDDKESDFLPTISSFWRSQKGEGGEGKPAFGGAIRGTAYHRALELLDFQRTGSTGQIRQQLEEIEKKGLMDESSLRLVRTEELRKFFASQTAARMRRADEGGKLYKERQFVMGIPAREMDEADSDELVLIQGIIDAYFEENGELVLVDYKTDRIGEGEEQLLLDRYRIQMIYYGRALEQITGKKVAEAILYSLALQKEIGVSLF